jgi:catechol 2,3-dioxygenase-like lactoylglutathione lyase family enzyme
MLHFTGVSHISLTVTDLAAARKFYGDTLGLREIERPNFKFPGAWYALQDDLSLHITVKDDWPLRPAGAFDTRDPHFALAVADADVTYERVHASGIAVHDFKDTPTGLRQLFVRDPQGNMIELIGPTKLPRTRS